MEESVESRNAHMTRTYARNEGLLDEGSDYGALANTLCETAQHSRHNSYRSTHTVTNE